MTINWEPTGRRVYFFEPHQDDGSLFMAQVAAHHMLAGREVHVVLMSNGSTSSALEKLNGEIHTGPWWGGFHDPAREGYAPLGQEDFGLARTRELLASWTALGVPPERVHFGDGAASSADLPDGVSDAWAEHVMRHWMDTDDAAGRDHPGMYTMWWNDTTADHAACGRALRELRLHESWYADARWCVRQEQAGAAGVSEYQVPAALLAEVKLLQKRAAYAYGAWSPRGGEAASYAIGMHSVSALFNSGPLIGAPNHIVRYP